MRQATLSPEGATEAPIIVKQHPLPNIEVIVKRAICLRLTALPPRWGLAFSWLMFQGFGPSGRNPWLLSIAPSGLLRSLRFLLFCHFKLHTSNFKLARRGRKTCQLQTAPITT
jgi:hypothetical protein